MNKYTIMIKKITFVLMFICALSNLYGMDSKKTIREFNEQIKQFSIDNASQFFVDNWKTNNAYTLYQLGKNLTSQFMTEIVQKKEPELSAQTNEFDTFFSTYLEKINLAFDLAKENIAKIKHTAAKTGYINEYIMDNEIKNYEYMVQDKIQTYS